MNDERGNTGKIVRIAKVGYISISILFCLGGILLLLYHEVPEEALAMITGVLLVICGSIKLLGYFSKDLYRLAFQFDFAMGVFVVLSGAFLLTQERNIMSYFLPFTGVLVLLDSLLKLQTAVDAKRFGLKKWWLIGLLALLTSITGALVILLPLQEETIAMIGAGTAFLLDGILNLIVAVCAVKIIKKAKQSCNLF